MPKKTLPPDASALYAEMCEENFWNVGFSYDLRKVKTPEIKEALITFRTASKILAKTVGYPL